MSHLFNLTFGTLPVCKDAVNKFPPSCYIFLGQERFGSSTHVYYRYAQGAIIVFDVTSQTSLLGVRKWREDICNKMQPDSNIPILLLANKVDLLKNCTNQVVTELQIQQLCDESKTFIGWFFILGVHVFVNLL
eukprot:TRINITY_DN2190_c0_g1_i18.p1 TRINITY_DN2190_c0_g1~~TRINITY_DN2190_c0_g1_i18.p1  ORF type:complete len:133 (+),score=14.77 TRINITY_DN2190_c0_g1_i18:307-705(+)